MTREALTRSQTIAAGWFAIASLAAMLLRFPPDRHGFYPRCPISTYLHLQCPGCGTTRALAALLHGHLNEALHYNALTTMLLPIAVLYAAAHYFRKDALLRLPAPAVYSVLGVVIFFAVVRNLNF